MKRYGVRQQIWRVAEGSTDDYTCTAMDGQSHFPRSSGILLHVTSLPGPFGIGDIGPAACRFADFLAAAGQSLWQVLPLGPTGYGNSPYQSLSAFAGNPLLLSPERLAAQGLLAKEDLEALTLPAERTDYEAATRLKMPLYRKSFEAFVRSASPARKAEFDAFRARKAAWLDDFALFMALREAHGTAAWNRWEPEVRGREPAALRNWRKKLAGEVLFQQYLQFQFFDQWQVLKAHCRSRRVRLVGDIPIFVAHDSADVWANPETFYLDEDGEPTVVAGVPPDYFSRTGQRWGNPLYRWDVLEHDGYGWWLERLRATYELVDIVRIDHFRGFESYWEIPGTAETAIDGRWVPGPGAPFFEIVHRELGAPPIIAEDLGVITPDVEALRDRFGLPGMKVLQFAFGGDPADEKNLPHRYPQNCVVYTGTHDNDTTVGWSRSADGGDTTRTAWQARKEINAALDYLGTDGGEINWDFIHLAAASPAHTAVFPLQDVLGLGSEARMNLPARQTGNWEWRFTSDMLSEEMVRRLRGLTVIHGRSVSRVNQ